MRKVYLFLSLCMAGLIFIALACSKNEKEGSTHLVVKMTDNPFNASEVNVDLLQVRVNFSDDSAGWVDLPTNAGVYNLLELQNGIDTIIAQGMVPSNTLKEIRFVLGDDNSIVIDSTEYPLTIPSGSESGLKIKLQRQLNATLDSLLIDFDAALSIHQTGTGEYKLKPVLKLK